MMKMKKIVFNTLIIVFAVCAVLFSCKKKNDSDAITPGWGTTGQSKDMANNVTTTGTINTTSSAQNSAMTGVGQGSFWSSQGCSLGQTCLSVNSNLGTVVELCFATGTITPGAYTIVKPEVSLIGNNVHLKCTSPTQQVTGSVWYGQSGVVNVSSNGTAITGNYNNIPCQKSGTNFPIVTLSGQVGCL